MARKPVDSQVIRQQNNAKDISIALGMGVKPGVRPGVKFGSNESVTGIGDVWAGYALQAIYLFPADAGENIRIISTISGDVGQPVRIFGLDVDGNEKVIDVPLNGDNFVNVPGGVWRAVNSAYIEGATEVTGVITIEGLVSGNVFGVILPADQQTSQTAYMVPKDKTFILLSISAVLNKALGVAAEGVFKLLSKLEGKVFRTRGTVGLLSEASSSVELIRKVPATLPELTQIRIEVNTSSDSDVSAEYSFALVDNDVLTPQFLAAIKEL